MNFIPKTSQAQVLDERAIVLLQHEYHYNNNIIDAALQHTMETIYLMRHWIIRKEREDEDAQERWKDATNAAR